MDFGLSISSTAIAGNASGYDKRIILPVVEILQSNFTDLFLRIGINIKQHKLLSSLTLTFAIDESDDNINALLIELVRYLILQLRCDDFDDNYKLLPHPAVNVAFQQLQHINLKVYISLCEAIINEEEKFFSCDPNLSSLDEETKTQRYALTTKLYFDVFKTEPNPLFWGNLVASPRVASLTQTDPSLGSKRKIDDIEETATASNDTEVTESVALSTVTVSSNATSATIKDKVKDKFIIKLVYHFKSDVVEQEFKVKVKTSTSLLTVLQYCSKIINVDCLLLRLRFNDMVLKSDQTVGELGISNGDVIQVDYFDPGIILHVVDGTNEFKISFIVKLTTRMLKIKKAFADKFGLNVGQLRFIYGGSKMNGDGTPLSYKMEDNDEITVLLEQVGDIGVFVDSSLSHLFPGSQYLANYDHHNRIVNLLSNETQALQWIKQLHGNSNAVYHHITNLPYMTASRCSLLCQYVDQHHDKSKSIDYLKRNGFNDFKLYLSYEQLSNVIGADTTHNLISLLLNTDLGTCNTSRVNNAISSLEYSNMFKVCTQLKLQFILRKCSITNNSNNDNKGNSKSKVNDEVIGFHTDTSSHKTLQVSLNDSQQYQGAHLVYLTHQGHGRDECKGVIHVPQRLLSSATIHADDIVHGVTPLTQGVRYSLFVLLPPTSNTMTITQ